MNDMQSLVWRNELKHELNKGDCMRVESFVRTVACADKNAGADAGYQVRSLYFDNVYDKALLEKTDGINEREKFRLRFYNHDPSYINLEKKMRYEGKSLKISCRVNEEECKKIIAGDTDFMKDENRPLLYELYAKMKSQQLRPFAIVDYTRKAYSYPSGNVRITFDSDIRTVKYSSDIFNASLPSIPVYDGVILEVKYDKYIPDIIGDIVRISQRRTTPFSKYAVSRCV